MECLKMAKSANQKYFDIYVNFGGNANGYSIPVIAKSKADAKQKALDEGLFYDDDDVDCIAYIKEISRKDYVALSSC